MVGVLSVGPYNPSKFLAAVDFRSGLTLGKGLKMGVFGGYHLGKPCRDLVSSRGSGWLRDVSLAGWEVPWA